MTRTSGAKRLVMWTPRLERIVGIARAGGILLIPPAVFWIVFALSVFGVWESPLALWLSMPDIAQAIALILCPILTLVSGLVRLRWDRGSPRSTQAGARYTALGAMFLLLTVLAMVRAA